MATDSQKVEKITGEPVWKKFDYFGDEKTDFNIEKKDFPENALCYVNQGYLSTVKNSEFAIYNHNFIIGQLIVAANQPKNIDECDCRKGEVKLVTCIYGKSIGQFNCLKLQLAYIVLRGDKESFFSYGVNEKKSSFLYPVAKERILNAFVSTCFKKHFHEVTEERRHGEEISTLFFYLPSITDGKEKINQFCYNVSPNLIDCSLDFLNNFSPDFNVTFQPQLLNSNDPGKRDSQAELLCKSFRQLAKTSNANLICNADCLLASDNDGRDNSETA